MATLNTLGVGSLALRGAGDQYHNLSRIFASLAEAQAAKANGDFVPEAGRANLVLVVGHGLMRWDDTENDFVPVDSDIRTRLQERIDEILGSVGENFDTLKELADAIGNSPTFFTDTNETLATLTGAIASETSARSTADNDLQTEINDNDSFLKDLIGSDAVTSDMGAFTGGIIADASTVKEALQALETALEAVDLDTDDLAALTGISENITHLGGFTGSIIGDDVSVKEALQALETAGEAEATRALAAEAALQADVDQNEADADAAIAAENAAMLAAVAVVQADVDQNESDADAAIAALQADVDQNESDADAAIAAENAAMLAAVAAVQADVDQNEADADAAIATERGRIDAILSGTDADKDTFAEIVTLINSVDTTNDNAFAAYVLSNDAAVAAVQADVDQNEADADAAIAAVQADVDQNEADADAAIAAVQADVDQNEADADAAIAAVQADVDQNEVDRKAVIDIQSNITSVKNAVRGTSIEIGNNIAIHPAAGGRVEIEGDLLLDNQTDVIDGAGVTLTSFTNINAYDGRLNTLEADPTTATAVAAVQADVDQNEADADAAIAVERARIDAILAGADADKDTFAEIVTLINSVDTTNDNAFAAYVLSNDAAVAAVQADVDQNESDADAADAALSARLDTLEADPTTKSYVDGTTAAEATARTTADDAIDTRIDNLEDGTTNFTGFQLAGTVVTATGAELNFVDGVTSAIQDQLDAIQADVNQNESDADTAIAANEVHVDNLVSLSGVAKDQVHLSTFTGSTIVDNRTVKAALQDLETAVETKLDSSAVSTFGGTLVDDADAAAARTTLGLGSAATTDSGDYATAAQGATADAALPAAGAQAALSVDHLITLSGVAEAADDLGTFTGATITDSSTIKTALQELETAQEATQADVDQNESDADAAIAAILAGTSIPGPYNNDSDAATAGVAVGAIYKNSNGSIHWRVS